MPLRWVGIGTGRKFGLVVDASNKVRRGLAPTGVLKYCKRYCGLRNGVKIPYCNTSITYFGATIIP